MDNRRAAMPEWEQKLEREWDEMGLSEEDRKDPMFQWIRNYWAKLAAMSPEEREKALRKRKELENLLYPPNQKD